MVLARVPARGGQRPPDAIMDNRRLSGNPHVALLEAARHEPRQSQCGDEPGTPPLQALSATFAATTAQPTAASAHRHACARNTG